MKNDVIAIVGTIASGKTTAAKALAEDGYTHYKLNQGIYEEADTRGLDKEDRVVLQNLGDEMRKESGSDVLAKKIIEKVKNDKKNDPNAKFVIESIRNHNELQSLKDEFGDDMTTISVDAPVEERFERAVEREGQYKEQNMSFEEFQAIDNRDKGEGNADNEQNVQKAMDMADVKIQNNTTLEDFKQSIFNIIKENLIG